MRLAFPRSVIPRPHPPSASLVLAMLATACATANGARADTPNDARERARRNEASGVHGGFLAGVGFPRPLALEGLVDFHRMISLGGEYAAMPKATFANLDVSLWSVGATVRLHPAQNAFFLGLRAGYQHVDVGTMLTIDRGTASERVSIGTGFLNPRVGVLFTWKSGFSIGFDAGVQLPVTTTVSTTLPSGTVAEARAIGAAGSFGRNAIPTIDPLRIGFVP
jgi:hypothetical protein